MARPLQIEFAGALYHLTSRGDRREAIYEDDEDQQRFLDTLAEVAERYNWICRAYCLMTNYYHLVAETFEGNLSQGMRHLNGVMRWITLMPALTIPVPWANFRPGSRQMPTAWTTWIGCAGPPVSSARPVVTMEPGGWAMVGTCAPGAEVVRR